MTTPSRDNAERRFHSRLPMKVSVRLVADGGDQPLVVQNQDISWGGVQFLVPRDALKERSSVTMAFPWAKGEQFSVEAEVVRTRNIDDGHALVAARFSNLSRADQKRLEKLLAMLHATNNQAAGHREDQSLLAPSLEILFNDLDDMQQQLAEIAKGRLSVTVFQAYEVNQSIRLTLAGIADLPALRLRARVKRVTALTTEAAQAFRMFDVDLSFEHPLLELEAAVESLMKRLASPAATTPNWSDTEFLLDRDM
ncbi:PilZ domain-containing protein [Thioalkalicoccus limnaeus]|uniref:PilZ domain-containing protein n=1 Tax=Thioalkalicoccus limnaeus TaxID=120681 RepID=A0ABV4B983_9GAMM